MPGSDVVEALEQGLRVEADQAWDAANPAADADPLADDAEGFAPAPAPADLDQPDDSEE